MTKTTTNGKLCTIVLRGADPIEVEGASFAFYREDDGGVTVKGFDKPTNGEQVFHMMVAQGAWLAVSTEDQTYYETEAEND